MFTKKKIEIPFMEYASPRRVLATPMLAGEAIAAGMKTYVPIGKKDKEKPGYCVKQPVGDSSVLYWIPEEEFAKTHIRTDKYTIGEAVLLLLQGKILTRPTWPKNEMIRWDWDSKTQEGFTRGATIMKVSIYADPMGKEEPEVVVDPWVPLVNDLLAKDFQILNIDFTKLKEGE